MDRIWREQWNHFKESRIETQSQLSAAATGKKNTAQRIQILKMPWSKKSYEEKWGGAHVPVHLHKSHLRAGGFSHARKAHFNHHMELFSQKSLQSLLTSGRHVGWEWDFNYAFTLSSVRTAISLPTPPIHWEPQAGGLIGVHVWLPSKIRRSCGVGKSKSLVFFRF